MRVVVFKFTTFLQKFSLWVYSNFSVNFEGINGLDQKGTRKLVAAKLLDPPKKVILGVVWTLVHHFFPIVRIRP